MIRVSKNLKVTSWEEVEIHQPGVEEPFTVEIEFLHIKNSEMIKVTTDPKFGRQKTDADLFKKVIVDWKGFADEDGKELPCTPKNIDLICEYHWIANAITIKWIQIRSISAEKKISKKQ